MQPVYNYCKAVSYMTEHLLKSENSTSEAMKQTVQDIKHQNPYQGKQWKTSISIHLFKADVSTWAYLSVFHLSLMQIPNSINLQTSGPVFPRRTIKTVLNIISLTEIYLQKNIHILCWFYWFFFILLQMKTI